MAASTVALIPLSNIKGPHLISGDKLDLLVNRLNAISERTIIIPCQLATLANSQVWKINIPFAFVLNKVGFRVGNPVTTAAKLATATAQISGTAVTGGVVALTSAACTPTGALVAGSAVTGANAGAANTTLEVAISAVTTFVEGDGYFEFDITASA